ncbi:MAG: helix-turn-helix domain-containing protein [Panacagrimonas sp.]
MTTPTEAWRGQVQMGIGWGLFVGRAGDGATHAHHAVQVLLSESAQAVWTRPTGWLRVSGIVIGADVEHQLAPTTESVTLLYVEPHSAAGRHLGGSLRDGAQVLDPGEVAAARRALGDTPDTASIAALVEQIGGVDRMADHRPTGDALIAELIESLPARLPDRLTTATLAEQARLSQSRFLHRFRAHTGLPLRPYLRWRRLLVAMTGVMEGRSLTQAAVDAGFADAAHFTRTFRRHFGIPPKTLLDLQPGR